MNVLTPRASLDDLAREDGKAELINGRIVPLLPTGDLPGSVAEEIFVSLRLYSRTTGSGFAHGDNVGFVVPPLTSGRESFSPDASFTIGARPIDRWRFIERAPTLAVEVRSENDYGPAAEAALAAKRADYFEAGTSVVWDVDPEAETVAAYLATAPGIAVVFKRGDIAHAEPAVPGWRLKVDEIFAE